MRDLQLLTCSDVAKLLKVSLETVRNMAVRGELPGRKVGRGWRFPQTAIEAYIYKDLLEDNINPDQSTGAIRESVDS